MGGEKGEKGQGEKQVARVYAMKVYGGVEV